MPVLCHTSRLTDRAWRLAQAYDVRLLSLEDLEGDHLPPLTRKPSEGCPGASPISSPGRSGRRLQYLSSDSRTTHQNESRGPCLPGAETALLRRRPDGP